MRAITGHNEANDSNAHCTYSELNFLFSKVFARAPVALAVAALDDGCLIEANQTFLDLIEFNRKDAIGKTTSELGMWPDRLHRDRRRKNISERGFEKSEEIVIRCQSGNLRHVLVSSQLVIIDGKKCALGVGVDISERKQIEADLELAKDQAEAASFAKSNFLATVSHEIRTPLTAIKSLSQLTLQKLQNIPNLASDLKDAIERIHKNSHFVVELVNGILDMSKIEAERLDISKQVFDLNRFLNETFDSLKCLAEIKHLKFETNLTGVENAYVYTDKIRLKQIINNIVGNAIKFTPEGSIQINAALIGPYSNRDLIIVIEDTGIGIPKDKKNLLFKSFSQVDSSASRKYGGTGLGLYLSRRLARLLGGDVSLVESEEKEGSIFRIVVNAGSGDSLSLLSQNGSALNETHNASVKENKKGHILVIEDNLDIQVVVKEYLTLQGYGVDLASDGKESISRIMHHSYDTVLMDMHMPGLNGMEATKALRHIGYAGRIIAFSAATQKSDQDRALAAGCDGFLAKPFEFKDLLNAVGPSKLGSA